MSQRNGIAGMGDTLSIHYVCKDDNGTVLESTKTGPAPKIVLGNGDILDALEKAYCGMKVGQVKNIRLEPEETFGEYDPELVDEVPRQDLEADLKCKVEVGMTLSFEEDGEEYGGTVTEVTDDMVYIDANHPLAGVPLSYELTLVGIGD